MKFIKKIITFIKIFYQKRKLRKQNKKQPMKSSFINPNATVINVGGETSVLDVDLIDKNISEKARKKVRQFTKTIIITYTITSIIWITWSYLLATYAMIVLLNVEPMSSLSEKVCDVISGYIIVYCLKAFFETFAEKGMELIERHINKDIESSESINSINDDEPVG